MKKIMLAVALAVVMAALPLGFGVNTAEAAKCIKGPGGGNAVLPAPLPGPVVDLLWC